MTKRLLPCLLIACLSGCALSKGTYFGRKSDQTLDRSISIARLTERHGNVQQARTMYTRIASEHPDNAMAHHRLGVLAGKAGNYQEAMQHLNRARQVGGDTPDLLCDIGYLHYLQNEHAAAESFLRAAITADPHHKRAQNTLGMVLAEDGRFNEALASFRRAVSEAEALSNLAYVQVQLGEFEQAEANYHRALSLDQSLKPAAEGLMTIAAIQGKLNPVHAEPNRREMIARREAKPTGDEHRAEPQQTQLVSYGHNADDIQSRGSRASGLSDESALRHASHQRTTDETLHELIDPRVGTTSRQIEMAPATSRTHQGPQTAVSGAHRQPKVQQGSSHLPAKRPITATTDPTQGHLPGRNPSWSGQQAAVPLIP